jgi:type II secretory pathway component GspD/PulD (secretin)
VYDSVDYQDITSGFYVTPRLIGNNSVSLQVQPHYRSINEERAGTIDVQESDTTVEARLGEWIQIGGIDTDASSKDSGILNTSRSSKNIRSDVFIKVDFD